MGESQLKKSYKSYQDLIEEHTKKLNDWLANPDAYDNKGILKNNPQHRQKIIQGRAKELQSQINKQQGELNKIIEAAKQLGTSLN
jgi:hypothetical protein